MPTTAPHLCPRCGPTTHTSCPAALDERRQQTERVRGTSTDRGYDTSWRVVRVHAITRDAFRCVSCGWEPEMVRLAKAMGQPIPVVATLRVLTALQQAGERHLHVDHIQAIDARPDLRLDISNLRTLCNVCHNSRTAHDQGWGRGSVDYLSV